MSKNIRVKLTRGDETIIDSDLNAREKEDNSSMGQGKMCSELTQFYLELDLFRIINDDLYMYDEELGYFKKLRNGREALELIRLIEDKIRRNRISSKAIEEVVKRLKNIPEINLDYENINVNKELINCKNGVVNIQTGELFQHNPSYLFTYCINANYQANSSMGVHDEEIPYGQETLKFLKTSLNDDVYKRRLLIEIIGYLISDFNNAKKAFIFLGKPHSGKSLLTKIISNLIGCENISNIPFHKLGERFSIAELSSHKLNINAELDSSPIRKISSFKAIVGNDYIKGEFKGKPLFSFKNKCKLLFCGNYMPEIVDIESTQAFTDRLQFLIFDRSVPKEEIDYELEEKLMNEIDVIFTKSVAALRNLINNNFKFTIPKDSKEFLHVYSNRQNHIPEFINECCYMEEEAKVHSKDLYNVYLKFCKDNCIADYNFNKFSEYISNIDGIEKSRFRFNGNNLRGFKGITIKNLGWSGTGTIE